MSRKVRDNNNITPATLCVARTRGKCIITYVSRSIVANMIEYMKMGIPPEYLGIYYAIGVKKVIMLTTKYKDYKNERTVDRIGHLVFRRSIAFFLLLRVPLHKIAEMHKLDINDLIEFIYTEMDYFVATRRLWQDPKNFVSRRIRTIYGIDFSEYMHTREYLLMVRKYYIQIYMNDAINFEFNYQRAIR